MSQTQQNRKTNKKVIKIGNQSKVFIQTLVRQGTVGGHCLRTTGNWLESRTTGNWLERQTELAERDFCRD